MWNMDLSAAARSEWGKIKLNGLYLCFGFNVCLEFKQFSNCASVTLRNRMVEGCISTVVCQIRISTLPQ